MKVRAIAKGYYGHQIRQIGEVFELTAYEAKNEKGEKEKVSAEDQFSDQWMETADGSAPPSVKRPGQNVSTDDREDPNKPFNPNVSDNLKSMADIELAHGGEQDPKTKKKAEKGVL
jgi:hypothetical protein